MKKNKPKKVTAPVSFDPGKGRPKEHLAYLNYQEMEALRRLNGEGPYKGPKGIPSFVLGGFGSAGSGTYSSSGSQQKSASKSTTKSSGPTGGSLSSPSRTAPSTGSSTAARGGGGGGGAGDSGRVGGGGGGGTARSIGGGGGGGGGARDSGQAANRPSIATGGGSKAPTTGAPKPSTPTIGGGGGGGAPRSISGIGSPVDNSVKKAVEKQSALSARQTPALKQDQSKPSISQPTGVTKPTQTVSLQRSPMYGQGVSFASPLDARIENFQRINDARLAAGALGPEGVPSVSQIAAENARRLNAANLARQYSQYRSPPSVPPPAPQGVFGPRAGAGTDYLRDVTRIGMTVTGMTSPYSGSIPARYNAESTIRAYEEQKRSAVKPIQDRVPFYDLSSSPQYPRIDRDPTMVNRASVPYRPYDVSPPRGIAGMSFTGPGAPDQVGIGRPVVARNPYDVTRERQAYFSTPVGPQGPVMARNPYDVSRERQAYFAETQSPVIARNPYDVTRERQAYFSRPVGPDSPVMARNPYDVAMERQAYFSRMTGPDSVVMARNPYDVTMERQGPAIGGMSFTGPLGSEPERILAIETLPPEATVGVKPFMDPVADRIMQSVIPGSPPASLIEGLPTGTNVYKGIAGIPVPPPPPSGIESLDVPSEVVPGSQIDPETMAPRLPGSLVSADDAARKLYERMMAETAVRVRPNERMLYNTSEETLAKLEDLRKYPPEARVQREDTSAGVPGEETPESDFVDEGGQSKAVIDLGESSPPPSQQSAAPSQDATITGEAESVQETYRKRADVARRVGVPLINIALPGAGTILGQGFKQLNKSTQKLVDAYQDAGMTERKEMEEAFPNLIAHGTAMGIQTYYGMDKYNKWAQESGLRAPQSTGGGGGIRDIVQPDREYAGVTGPDETVRPPDTSTSGGKRPEIYYMWDLGVNVPSPGDPNYTQYQTYLIERAASQRAMGWV